MSPIKRFSYSNVCRTILNLKITFSKTFETYSFNESTKLNFENNAHKHSGDMLKRIPTTERLQ